MEAGTNSAIFVNHNQAFNSKRYINSLCIYLEFTLHTSLNTTPIPPKHNNNHQI
ncbi:hypothetical protein Hanom_Chr03g00215901 [Helianthus anomalus]